MSTCLITKLDGVVNDSSLRAPSEFRIKIKKQDTYNQARSWISMTFRKEVTVSIINEKLSENETENSNYIFDANGINYGKSTKFNGNVIRTIYLTNGNYELSIPDKYALGTFSTGRFSPQYDFFNFDIEELKYVPTIQTLQSSGTNAKGDIKALNYCTALQDLTLERTNVKGDLEDIADLINLKWIRFAVDADITGDISIIENMPDLRNLEIFGCIGITGNLSSFTNCSMLSWVQLPNVAGMGNIKGDIAALANKTNLVYFSCINEPKVTGDIAAFATITDTTNNVNNILQQLYLSSDDLEGDIADLAPCQRLIALNLGFNKNIDGNIGTFLVNKPYLSTIDVQSTGITGSITNANLPMLTSLVLLNTGIEGSIGKVGFAGLYDGNSNEIFAPHEASDGLIKHSPLLTFVNLSNTRIDGDIDVFADCLALNTLNIYNSNIKGDIASLANLEALTFVNVGYTDVHGDVGTGLANCTNLTQIDISCSPHLSGDLSKLGNNVKYINGSANGGTFQWSTERSNSAFIIAMANGVNFGNDLDAMLINQAKCRVNTNTTSTLWVSINVRGTHSSDPTVRANALAAIVALMNKGYSVTINGVLQTDTLVSLDATIDING